MIKVLRLMVIMSISIFEVSCSKSDSGFSCAAEGYLVNLQYHTDDSDPRKINFNISYSGDRTISSVDWQFGDDSEENSNMSTSHTYSTAGNYTVKAIVHLSDGSATCDIEPSQSITVY